MNNNTVLEKANDSSCDNEVPQESRSTEELITMDDPYWGGPQCHSLSHLLSQIQGGFFKTNRHDPNRSDTKQNFILFNNDQYLVINKPADLRMDGPYAATLLKLLLFWFPPPSLSSFQGDSTILMEKISSLHKHSDIPDFPLKAVHQLDYATSGVLLYGKTKPATALACAAFSNRTTKKEYLALVHGHVSNHTMPCLHADCLLDWEQGTRENEFRKKRFQLSQESFNPNKRDTWRGYIPPSAIFDMWKSQQRCTYKRKNRSHEIFLLSQSRLQHLPELDVQLVLNMSWKEVKGDAIAHDYFDILTREYNTMLKSQYEKEQVDSRSRITEVKRKQVYLPPFFRIQGEDENSFYIHLALAEIPNQFRVEVEAEWNPLLKTYDGDTHDSSIVYRPALTRCTILHKGEYEGLRATKICLQPRTGRRHQLRVHMACCGHAILGDATYEECRTTDGGSIRSTGTRMCLHAYKLMIPLTDKVMYEFVAPDPFV